MIEGTSTLKVEVNLINKALDSGEVIIIDPCSIRRTFTSIPEISWRILGWNASISLTDLLKEKFHDKYFMVSYLVEIFAKTFNLSSIEAKILTEALVELIDSSSELSFNNLTDKVEEISSTLPYSDRIRVMRLINLLQLLNLGRVGAALSNKAPLDEVNGSLLLDLSLIPWKFKGLIYGFLTVWCAMRSYNMLILGGPLPEGIAEVLRVTVDLILSAGHSSKLIVSGITQHQAERVMRNYPDFKLLKEMKVGTSTRWIYFQERGETYEVILDDIPLWTAYGEMPEQLLEPISRVKVTLLEKVFKREVDIAFKALAFLREGATTRDGLVSYLTYAFSIKTSHALRLVTKLVAYGLIEEVVGRDTKYWMRLTIRGYGALEEYEALRGGEEVKENGY